MDTQMLVGLFIFVTFLVVFIYCGHLINKTWDEICKAKDKNKK